MIHLMFEPKEDITTYELARIVPLLIYGNSAEYMMSRLERESPSVRRHFQAVYDPKDFKLANWVQSYLARASDDLS